MKKVILVLACGALAVVASGCGGDKLSSLKCRESSECPEGWVCADGICAACTADFECAESEHCVEGMCKNLCGPDGSSCDDGNPCTHNDTCQTGACISGPAVADGTVCGDSSSRSICLAAKCTASRCGDGFADKGATPPEDCDDGNTFYGDGCEADCTVLPPELSITFPQRGATLDGSSSVTVRGVATDRFHPIRSVTVNGQSATVAANGNWTLTMTAKFGVNALEVVATNDQGKTARHTVGFYYSASYLPYATPADSTAKLAAGRVMRVSQQAIDDGDHPCSMQNGVYTCSKVDDLATLGEITLNNLDLQRTVGAVKVYETTSSLLAKRYGYTCAGCMGISDLTVGGDVVVTGDVILRSEITKLDLNALKLALTAKAGGLDAKVSVDQVGATPGLVMTVRTTAEVPLVAKFDKTTTQFSYAGFDGLGVACGLFFDPTIDDPAWMSYLCPHGPNQDVDPLSSANPKAYADSGLSVGSMVMQSQFEISLAPGGGVQVKLVSGQVQFNGSTIDLDPIKNMVVDLGTLQVLGTDLDLGSYPLNSLVSNIDSMLQGLAGFLLNDLQAVLEPQLSSLLMNPNDPLSVGQMMKLAIEKMAPNGPIALAPFASQTAALQLDGASTISSVAVAATPGSPLTGGITLGLDTRISSDKVVQRSPLGTIRADGCYGSTAPAPAFSQTSALEDADHSDTLNQALFAAWWNGGTAMRFENQHLSQPLPSSLGVTAFAISPQFYTAPMLGNCNGESLTLQVADIHAAGQFTAGGKQHAFEAFVSAKLPVKVAIVAGKPVLQRITSEPGQFLVEDVTTTGVDPAIASTLTPLLQTVLVDEILLRYGTEVIDAVPEYKLDLNALAPSANGSVLHLVPQSSKTTAGYTVFAGALAP